MNWWRAESGRSGSSAKDASRWFIGKRLQKEPSIATAPTAPSARPTQWPAQPATMVAAVTLTGDCNAAGRPSAPAPALQDVEDAGDAVAQRLRGGAVVRAHRVRRVPRQRPAVRDVAERRQR